MREPADPARQLAPRRDGCRAIAPLTRRRWRVDCGRRRALLGGPRPIAAHDLQAAVDHQLRRVDLARAERFRELALAVAVVRRGKRIGPSQAIPVIDMFADRDALDSLDLTAPPKKLLTIRFNNNIKLTEW